MHVLTGMFPYFTENQIIPFIISAIIILASIFTFQTDNKRLALILLFFGSLALGYFIANLDHFLILWDEQYHALVAKNMMSNPFKPMLYSTPLLDYDYKSWTNNHVWLHKQPLFLWQIALSLKLFGINQLSVRIPSILMHSLATLMIYRVGKLANNANTGFYGALFFTVAYYPLELVTGKFATDHNDIAFLFYITASIWSWFEYMKSKKGYWLILIGVFSGCAVLVKWIMGLLVYAVWMISKIVSDKGNLLRIKSYFPILLSLLISVLVFLPWQIFILNQYPLEAKYEFSLNAQHFFIPIEGHAGNIWFHFDAIKHLYGSGDAVPFLLIIGLFFLVRNTVSTWYRVAMVSSIIITYGFYTVVATKMTSYCMIVSPFGFLALGALTDSVINYLKKKVRYKQFELLFTSISLISICYLLLDFSRIQNYHTDWKPDDNSNRKAEVNEMRFINKLKGCLQDEKYVVFNSNVRANGNIPVMFYTNFIAYDFIPDQKQIENIRMQSYQIAVVETGNLPDYIENDNNILKIKPDLD